MYLHFEDWSEAPSVVDRLSDLGLPHEEKVIKVFSSPEDPRTSLGRTALTVIETDGEAFGDNESFGYKLRRTYSGQELEEDLAAYTVTASAANIVRSLFRFSHEKGFCQAAMDLRRNGSIWVIKHPFQSIDGIDRARNNPDYEGAIHLDIFLPASLRSLLEVVDYRDEAAVLNWRDGIRRLSAPD